MLLRLYNETAELIDNSPKSRAERENDSAMAAEENPNADSPEAGNEEEMTIAVGEEKDPLISAGSGAPVDDR
jgi:hypothetical protein